MASPKVGRTKNSKLMHYAVGALIQRNGKYLLINRKLPPLGFAGLAGHVDEGEDAVTVLYREVKEESNLTVKEHVLVFEEEVVQEDTCVIDNTKPHY